MKATLDRLGVPVYAITRILAGFLFLCHGTDKLFGWPEGAHSPEFPSQHWWGGLIELVCGAMIMLGVQARLGAFLAAGTMAVAYFQFHQPKGLWPKVNGGEMAVLYCWIFLVILCKGPGIWTIWPRGKRA